MLLTRRLAGVISGTQSDCIRWGCSWKSKTEYAGRLIALVGKNNQQKALYSSDIKSVQLLYANGLELGRAIETGQPSLYPKVHREGK
ncbi:hypothetical protein [Coleofasciculus sp. FACHB-1120]|uniref:hypothetical protein n=1 Tax=Coleofasciculus sp. FACHB-1120 TaxID=2692783 RepID=UPI001684EE68|nr:hypothetical protein [Coleofasciculus sp. FACHB-1120]MBD2744624.1 hypothetical protein [Coleofasciculus sp. FACHB-1120]